MSHVNLAPLRRPRATAPASRHCAGLGLILCLGSLAAVPSAHAAPVGDIVALYYAPNALGISPTLDGPAFVFNNTSASAITDGVFSIDANGSTSADSFLIGTIAAGSDFVLEPGVTNDGQAGHTFFHVTGTGRDTSDNGPDGASVPFEFTGLLNGQTVDSGVFTPGATAKPSGDGKEKSINFLGGPDDSACTNCFDPTIVATLNTPNAHPTVPEPAVVALLGLGVLPLIAFTRRRRA